MVDHVGTRVPEVTFRTRVRDETIEGPNPFKWEKKTTADYFAGKRVILFSLPGAFTPTCSTYQLPGFENLYDEFVQEHGIDDIYCLSVNDAFVMNAWAKSQGITKVKVLPDGNAEFTQGLNMLVWKQNLGFGSRSWRYAAIIDDGVIVKWFEEPGFEDNCETDPYGESSPEKVINYLRAKAVENER
jgi:peroxiredoxin